VASPPTGTLTFLFTDIEGSTRLWEQNAQAMQIALARHDEILRSAIEERGATSSRRLVTPSVPLSQLPLMP
jgi:class 3 adenylate cyclase